MSTQLIESKNGSNQLDPLGALEQALFNNDLGKLTIDQRTKLGIDLCQSLGLEPRSRPFQYINLSGKLTLYATKDCTEQLRKIYGVSLSIVSREKGDGVYAVTARATDRAGRVDESSGVVTIQGLKGDALANALMKAETKAKRRVTLSICGLGILDESEIETIPNVQLLPTPPLRALETGGTHQVIPLELSESPWMHTIRTKCSNQGKMLWECDRTWLEAAVSPERISKLDSSDAKAIALALPDEAGYFEALDIFEECESAKAMRENNGE